MNKFQHDEDLTLLVPRDTLELSDGTIHVAMRDSGDYTCENYDCSIMEVCHEVIVDTIQCGDKKFHFIKKSKDE